MNTILFPMILLAAVGSGLMAGLFFVFSNFAMRALAKLPPAQGAAAMQSINVVILNPLFLLVFMGTAILSLASGVFAVLHWGKPGMLFVLVGSVLYLAGCIVVTGTQNVPLNNRLAAVQAESPEGEAMWEEYLAKWVPWNHVRTLATIAAMAAFVVAAWKLGGSCTPSTMAE